MSKLSIFSVLLVGSLLVAPVVTASNYSFNKSASAANTELNNSLVSTNSSLHLQLSSLDNSNLLVNSSSLVSNLSIQSSFQSESSSLPTKKAKIINDVKPVKLNAQAANWWIDVDTATGGNSTDLGNDAINAQIQSKLQAQCPNIYDSATKTINETNLANCTPINNLSLQKIAIVDSGVTPNAEMVPFIDQTNSWNFFTSNDYPAICTATSPLRFYTLIQGTSTTYYCKEKGTQSDTDSHGTSVAYTAIQTFKNSLLKNRIKIVPFSLRTLDTINISEAIDEVVRAADIKTANLSLGTPYNLNYVEDSVNFANTNGISVYASSGNCAVYTPSNCDYNGNTTQDLPEEADNAPDYPAAYPNAIMVGSTNYSENNIAGIIRATYSNFVTTLRSNFITAPVGNSGIILPCFVNCNRTPSYGYLGTSFASPQAAAFDGLISRYSQLMKLNLTQLNEKVLVSNTTPKQYVSENTTDVLAAGNDLQTGTGLINLKKISDKIVTQLQTLNVPVASSSVLSSSSTVTKNTMIDSITLNADKSAYIVTNTSNFIPAFGNDHIHFYYNTEAATVTNKMFSSSGPYTILVSTKPAAATQLCTNVGTASHGIYPNTGNCMNLPVIIQQVASSSVLSSSSTLALSSNVLSSSSNQTILSSSTQIVPSSSSQVSSSTQAISSPSPRSSSSLTSSSIQKSSSVVSSVSSNIPPVSSATQNNGGGIISIISGVISNVINSITGVNVGLSGNINPISSSSLSSVSSISSSSQSLKLQETIIKEQKNILAEDKIFAGLINNPSGSNNQSEIAIKEQGVKSPQAQVEVQSDYAIKEQGVKAGDNQEASSSSVSSNNSNQACKKGWDGSIKGNLSQDKSLAQCPVVSPEACKKGIKENGLKLSDNEAIDCSIDTNSECKKGWDGTVKGGNRCETVLANDLQSENKPNGDITQYIPVLIASIIGLSGIMVGVSYYFKIRN